MAEDAFNSFGLKLPSASHQTQFPYPSFEDHVAAERWIRSGISLNHILWLLDGSLESATSVLFLQNENNIVRQEPLVDCETGKWHPIADCPITEPKVSSITVSLRELDEWEDLWCDIHWDHSEPHLPDTDLDHYDPGEVLWSITERYRRKFLDDSESARGSDDDDDDDDDDDEIEDDAVLLRCCGQDRPRNKAASITIMASATDPDAGYVTIRDYVSALHPWLMGLRGEIVAGINLKLESEGPLEANAELTVNCISANKLSVIDGRDRWYRIGGLRSGEFRLTGKSLSQCMLTA